MEINNGEKESIVFMQWIQTTHADLYALHWNKIFLPAGNNPITFDKATLSADTYRAMTAMMEDFYTSRENGNCCLDTPWRTIGTDTSLLLAIIF